ncbi:MAG: SDR family oxidoreductase [Gammaproteobacteria bacterium]
MSEHLTGRRAVVTGASSGLGADFARELAKRGADLVLVARRREKLEALAAELEGRHGVQCRVHVMDLTRPAAPAQLAETLDAEGWNVDVLVNNAGFGVYARFLDTEWDRIEKMLRLDVEALAAMTRVFAPGMVQRGWGRVLQVASIAAFQPSPGYAAYAAAKSFVLSFGNALHQEWKGTGVSCTVVSPGVTETEFLQVAGQEKGLFHKATLMDSPTVARQGIEAMISGSPGIVPGWMNKVTTFSTRLIPRRLQAAVADLAMKS